MSEHYPKRWEPCRGGPVPLRVVEPGARTGVGDSRGDYMGCCSGSSQTSRSTCITYTPIPVPRPLGREKPVSSGSKNENTQVQKTSHHGTLLGGTAFLAVKTLPLPSGGLHMQERQVVYPGDLSSKGGSQAGTTEQFRRAQWKKTSSQNLPPRRQLTEKQMLHAYSFEYWSYPLAQKVTPSAVQNPADEVKSQNILLFLHPDPITIPQDRTLEKTLLYFSSRLFFL